MTEDGRRQIVAFHVPGDLFGYEVGDTHRLSAEAATDMRVRRIKPASLLNIAGRDDDVAQQLWLNISREIRRNQDHILQLGKAPQLASSVFSWKWPDACRAPMHQLCRCQGGILQTIWISGLKLCRER